MIPGGSLQSTAGDWLLPARASIGSPESDVPLHLDRWDDSFFADFALLTWFGMFHADIKFGICASLSYFGYFLVLVPVSGLVWNTLADVGLDRRTAQAIGPAPHRDKEAGSGLPSVDFSLTCAHRGVESLPVHLWSRGITGIGVRAVMVYEEMDAISDGLQVIF